MDLFLTVLMEPAKLGAAITSQQRSLIWLEQSLCHETPQIGRDWRKPSAYGSPLYSSWLILLYFLLIPALGLEGQPSQGWMWAVVPVIDMLYIAVQAFCLILSGARSNVFGFTDIAVSWASSVIMGVLACWVLFSPTVSLSPFQTMVLVCNLVAATAESGLTQFGRMAFSRRTIGFGG